MAWVSKIFEIDHNSECSLFGGSAHDRVLVVLNAHKSLGCLIKCGFYYVLQLDLSATDCSLSEALFAASDHLYVQLLVKDPEELVLGRFECERGKRILKLRFGRARLN